jgi:hypothetical protein
MVGKDICRDLLFIDWKTSNVLRHESLEWFFKSESLCSTLNEFLCFFVWLTIGFDIKYSLDIKYSCLYIKEGGFSFWENLRSILIVVHVFKTQKVPLKLVKREFHSSKLTQKLLSTFYLRFDYFQVIRDFVKNMIEVIGRFLHQLSFFGIKLLADRFRIYLGGVYFPIEGTHKH